VDLAVVAVPPLELDERLRLRADVVAATRAPIDLVPLTRRRSPSSSRSSTAASASSPAPPKSRPSSRCAPACATSISNRTWSGSGVRPGSVPRRGFVVLRPEAVRQRLLRLETGRQPPRGARSPGQQRRAGRDRPPPPPIAGGRRRVDACLNGGIEKGAGSVSKAAGELGHGARLVLDLEVDLRSRVIAQERRRGGGSRLLSDGWHQGRPRPRRQSGACLLHRWPCDDLERRPGCPHAPGFNAGVAPWPSPRPCSASRRGRPARASDAG
jgi:hypothetical protein